MEFEKGGSLLDSIRNGKEYSKDEILRMIQDITSGLCYLLSKGLMHRDIKPHNILISEEGRMKLCDFEFLKDIDHSTHSITIGHPGYMAPEFNLQNGKYTEKIDIWSLGMTLLQILTKKGIMELSSHRNKYLEEIKEINKDIYDICELCLKENPDERISAKDLNEHVHKILSDFFRINVCLITSTKGKILFSKFAKESSKIYEKDIEEQISIILQQDVKVSL